MAFISIEDAAARLCTSTQYVRKLRSSGVLTAGGGTVFQNQTVSLADVDRLARVRRGQERRRIGDMAAYAKWIHSRLRPTEDTLRSLRRGGAEGPVSGIAALGADANRARLVFGRAALSAAAFADGMACRWCYANAGASVHHDPAPSDTPEWRALFGGEAPCPRDAARWNKQRDELVASADAGARRRAQAQADATGRANMERARSARAMVSAGQAVLRGGRRVSDELLRAVQRGDWAEVRRLESTL